MHAHRTFALSYPWTILSCVLSIDVPGYFFCPCATNHVGIESENHYEILANHLQIKRQIQMIILWLLQ